MRSVARLGDMHACPNIWSPCTEDPGTCGLTQVFHIGGPITDGSSSLMIDGQPVARAGDPAQCVGLATHDIGGDQDLILEGSAVFIVDGRPVARKGDRTIHNGVIIGGSESFIVGGPSVPIPALMEGFMTNLRYQEQASKMLFGPDRRMTYDPDWAVRYAVKNHQGLNTPFPDMGNNCTIFATEVLIAGFIRSDDPWTVHLFLSKFDTERDARQVDNPAAWLALFLHNGEPNKWYFSTGDDYGQAATVAHQLYEMARGSDDRPRAVEFQYVGHVSEDAPNIAPRIRNGDMVFFDYTGNGDIEHIMTVHATGDSYDDILLAGRSNDQTDRKLGDILNEADYDNVEIEIYRPIDYDPSRIER